MYNIRGKTLLSLSNNKKVIENEGSLKNYSQILQQASSREDHSVIHSRNETDMQFDHHIASMVNCSALQPLSLNETVLHSNCQNFSSPFTICDLQPVPLTILTSTPIPELRKEDLIELDGTLYEDIDLNDLDSVNENILLDLTVNKRKSCAEKNRFDEVTNKCNEPVQVVRTFYKSPVSVKTKNEI